MGELQTTFPEAEEVRYPEADWHRRYFNVFDWYRAQTVQVRADALSQWEQDGTAHLMEGQGDPANRCELWYCELGRFFVRISIKGGVVQDGMQWFQSESCLKMYGAQVIGKAREMGLLKR